MPRKQTKKGLVINYDKAPNPTVDLPWRDPNKQYSWQTFGIGWRRLLRLTYKNYATIPLILVGMMKLSWLDWFTYYKLTTTADLFYPHGEQEPWHQFEHKHTKLNRVDMEPVLRQHPRPKFEYQRERRQLEFKWFPLSARYYWPSERQSQESKESGSH